MTINEAQDEIVEEFELFGDDPDMRNSYIIDLGRKLPPMPPEFHTDQYIVKGCQAQVWVHTDAEGGKLFFRRRQQRRHSEGADCARRAPVFGPDPAGDRADRRRTLLTGSA